MGKKQTTRQMVVDAEGNIIPCMTVDQAANHLSITKRELRLWMFHQKQISFYFVKTLSGSRVKRLKVKDVERFAVETEFFDKIADKIKQAMDDYEYVAKGMSQAELARRAKLQRPTLNYIVNKKERPTIRTLKRLAKALDKKLEDFL